MNNIRNFRERFGLTQEDLAKVLGCTRGAVCHYETGRRGMDINLCRAFINAFINLCRAFIPTTNY
ncbi:Cro phage repressor protein [Salmonella enterica subsp. enterica serovar Montevideo str. S5-403]|uniref:Cro phage repressor protein n=1 Tax=Salmonella enterica subsp. enterica serovar Montevideo str. S5-403 TaxID=913242 RepID=G5Q5M6_SALMO|nr:Cro phage repressor protein [Salmonella enterica subsp. enterica serovar Montevideo str. S5-403]